MADLTPGDSATRKSPIFENDHAGSLWIMTILAVLYSLLTAAVRTQIKKRAFGIEDALFYVALVCHASSLSAHYRSMLETEQFVNQSRNQDLPTCPINTHIRWTAKWPGQIQHDHYYNSVAHFRTGKIIVRTTHTYNSISL